MPLETCVLEDIVDALWRGPTADSVRGIGTFRPWASISAAYPTGVASGSLMP